MRQFVPVSSCALFGPDQVMVFQYRDRLVWNFSGELLTLDDQAACSQRGDQIFFEPLTKTFLSDLASRDGLLDALLVESGQSPADVQTGDMSVGDDVCVLHSGP